MTELEWVAMGVSLMALGMAAWALRRATLAAAALEAERLERQAAFEKGETAAMLAATRIESIEQRVGRGRRLTAEKRERALELLAHGATETAVAQQLEMREAEVAALARLAG